MNYLHRIIALLFILLVSAGVRAQPPLEAGQRVRMEYPVVVKERFLLIFSHSHTENRKIVGTVDSLWNDSVLLRDDIEENHMLSLTETKRIWQSTGKRRATWEGLKLGAGLGACLGAIMLGVPTEDRISFDEGRADPSFGDRVVLSSATFGFFTVTGLVIGWFSHVDTWEQVPLEMTTGAGQPDQPDLALRLTIRF